MNGFRHEVNDELCQGGVEGAVLEWELFRGCSLHIDRWVPLPRRSNKGLGGIDGGDVFWSHALDKLIAQGAWAATHVEHSESLDNRGKVCEDRSERRAIPTHESVVGAGPDSKAHKQEATPRLRTPPKRRHIPVRDQRRSRVDGARQDQNATAGPVRMTRSGCTAEGTRGLALP